MCRGVYSPCSKANAFRLCGPVWGRGYFPYPIQWPMYIPASGRWTDRRILMRIVSGLVVFVWISALVSSAVILFAHFVMGMPWGVAIPLFLLPWNERDTDMTERIDIDYFETKILLLPWQERGQCYTASGYGNKIPTQRMVKYMGKWRRIYSRIFSNAGTCYIIVNRQQIIVN